MTHDSLFQKLGISPHLDPSGDLPIFSPLQGEKIATLKSHTPQQIDQVLLQAQKAFLHWRDVPPPQRGEVIRLLAHILRENKDLLAYLVTLECGKILEEAKGEVQEMIDMCDFAVGLSRQLYGLTMASERPGHRMMETWHPLGIVGIISAFNFPVAVWAWNFALALVCGNSVVWKPSEKTPLCALACQALFLKACSQMKGGLEGLSHVLIGDRETAGIPLVSSPQVPLISATGSTRMGRDIGGRVAQRFGRSLLELGGNNAMILCPSADLQMALQAVVFSAVGTAGQRCTSLRRLMIHTDVYDFFITSLKASYAQIRIGNPLTPGTLIGPLRDENAFEALQMALRVAQAEGGHLLYGGERVLQEEYPHAYYVRPALMEMPFQTPIVLQETFGPLLYIFRYKDLESAIDLHNAVPQGLSSSIFTTHLKEAELFLSARGSDCGIANVNIGPSGAEIGGAFGGEKETGGGRESGSDAWKSYMRRQTNTINYSSHLPLAQGLKFEI